MTISSIIPAPLNDYPEDEICSICRFPLNDHNIQLRTHLKGTPIIHNSPNGIKHPMHSKCLEGYVTRDHLSAIGTSKCPICRESIFTMCLESEPKLQVDSITDKTIKITTLIIILGASHALLSYPTGQPLPIAITPGVLLSLMSLNLLYLQHSEIGLERPLIVEITTEIATSAVLIGIPLLATRIASEMTKTTISHSLLTAMIGVCGISLLLPIVKNPRIDNILKS